MNWDSWKRLFIALGFSLMTLALCLAVEQEPFGYSTLDYIFIGVLCFIVLIGILRIQAFEMYMQMQQKNELLGSRKDIDLIFKQKGKTWQRF